MLTLTTPYWYVTPRDGAWWCEQVDQNNQVLKSYKFSTQSWAQLCRTRMEHMDRAFYPQTLLSTIPTTTLTWIPNQSSSFVLRTPHRELIRIGHTGVLEYVDLPHIVWAWMKNTAPIKMLKTFWYGENHDTRSNSNS